MASTDFNLQSTGISSVGEVNFNLGTVSISDVIFTSVSSFAVSNIGAPVNLENVIFVSHSVLYVPEVGISYILVEAPIFSSTSEIAISDVDILRTQLDLLFQFRFGGYPAPDGDDIQFRFPSAQYYLYSPRPTITTTVIVPNFVVLEAFNIETQFVSIGGIGHDKWYGTIMGVKNPAKIMGLVRDDIQFGVNDHIL